MAAATVTNRTNGKAIKYEIPREVMAQIVRWNQTLDESGRYDAVMSTPGLFRVAE